MTMCKGGDAVVTGSAATTAARRRVTGVDLARGLALLGMMAKHIFDDTTEHGPTATGLIASGRSAATFALVAGISVAFLSGGRRILHGGPRRAAAAGLAVRALMIGAIGLLLGYAGSGIELILAYYAVFFLLAIPLIGLPPRVLAALSVTFALAGPVLLVAAAGLGLPDSGTAEPTFTTLLTDPGGLLVQIFLTGDYPVVVYMAYLCAGLAIGRLDLRSRRLAVWLLGGGLALDRGGEGRVRRPAVPAGRPGPARGRKRAGRDHAAVGTRAGIVVVVPGAGFSARAHPAGPHPLARVGDGRAGRVAPRDPHRSRRSAAPAPRGGGGHVADALQRARPRPRLGAARGLGVGAVPPPRGRRARLRHPLAPLAGTWAVGGPRRIGHGPGAAGRRRQDDSRPHVSENRCAAPSRS